MPELDFANSAQKLARNPLGIIALFLLLVYGIAGLVFGLAAKSLAISERAPLIWFLVIFPVLVLLLFAWLVAWHHTKLYAPSDYRDTEGFFRALSATEQRQRLDAEVEVLQADVVEDGRRPDTIVSIGKAEGSNREPAGALRERSRAAAVDQNAAASVARTHRELRAAVLLAEDLAFRELESEFGAPIVRHVSVQVAKNDYVHLDGLIRTPDTIGVEVKYIRSTRNWRHIVGDAMMRVPLLRAASPRPWRLLLALVLDPLPAAERERIASEAAVIVGRLSPSVELRVYDFSELQRKFGVITA